MDTGAVEPAVEMNIVAGGAVARSSRLVQRKERVRFGRETCRERLSGSDLVR